MFDIGQDVVCVDDTHQHIDGVSKAIQEGQIYKIRWIGMAWHPREGDTLCVRVEGVFRGNEKDRLLGVVASEPEWNDMPFKATRFRPLTKEEEQAEWTQEAPLDSEQWDNRRKIKENV